MNVQMVRAGQGNLSLLSVQADQQYHGLQQYPEVLGDQPFPARGKGEKDKENMVRCYSSGQHRLTATKKVYMLSVKVWRVE